MNLPVPIEARCPECGRKMLPVTSSKVFEKASPIARELRLRRIELGWSQKKLAHRAGFTTVAIGLWERGIHTPLKFNMQCWKEALGYEG